MRISRLAFFVFGLAMLLLPTLARGQVTVTSATRTIAIASASGNSSDSRNTTGPWTRTLNVTDGTCTLVSNITDTQVQINFNFNVSTVPPGAIPAAVLQAQANFTITAPVALTLTRTEGLPANFSFSGPGIVIGNGTPPGTFFVSPGEYVLQYSFNGNSTLPTSIALQVDLAPIGPSETAFTYQGKLEGGPAGLPAAIDLQYSFWSAQTGGSQIAGTAVGTASNAAVGAGGVFTAQLDPGIDLPSTPVWLQIGVRPVGAPAFTPLSPRQRVSPAPKARRAAIADSAIEAAFADVAATASLALGVDAQQRITIRGESGQSGSSPGLWLASPVSSPNLRAFVGMSDSNKVGFYGDVSGWSLVMNTTSGFLGVGMDDPQYTLHALSATDAQLGLTSSSAGGRTWVIQSSSGNYGPGSQQNGSLQINDRTANANRILIDANGNVGIGTAVPQSKLQVFGGGVRADSFTFNSPVTSSLTIGEAAWQSRSGAAVSRGLGQGGVVLPNGDQFGVIAEFQVPLGATITGVSVYCVDNEASVNLFVALYQFNPTALTGVQQLSSSNFTGGPLNAVVAVNASPTTPTVAAANTVYRIQVSPSNGTWTSNLSVRGATITYTLPRPAQ